MSTALLSAATSSDQSAFSIKDNELFVDKESNDLDAYMWRSPSNKPVYFVFIENDVHIIHLDEGELPFDHVRTRTEKIAVMPINDEEVLQYSAMADELHAIRTLEKDVVWQ